MIGRNIHRTDEHGRLIKEQKLGGGPETAESFKKKIRKMMKDPGYRERSAAGEKKLTVAPGKLLRKDAFATQSCGGSSPYAITFSSGKVTMYPAALGTVDWAIWALTAMSMWTDVTTSSWEFWYSVASSPSSSNHYDGYSAMGWSSSLGYGVLGLTTTMYSSSTCKKGEADIQFDNGTSWGVLGEANLYHFPSVALHELGHVLGLGHTANGRRCKLG
ncbi:MAG: matrixin family metalloprotease [Nitrospinae bacterium]|nr:matrixin family metalloprotease [Nitrospinota bacterium]